MMRSKHNVFFLGLLLIIGMGVGAFLSYRGVLANLASLFCDSEKFQLINKELACEGSFIVEKHAYSKLKGRIEELIDDKLKTGEISESAIYFRDLENGPTLGINEHANFAPASLLKVPLLLAFLARSEEQPELLEKKLTYRTTQEVIINQLIPPRVSIQENTQYSVHDLLTYLIKYSDNKAYIILMKYLQQISPDFDLFSDTVQSLGIINPEGILEETISVKSYASIFLQLFHASFLNKKETSELALGFLTNTDFTTGIVAGVPKDITVAHKFGERSEFDGNIKQLHDCGIVYYPDNPYLVCIMTRGRELDQLSKTIAEISKMIYEEFDSRRI